MTQQARQTLSNGHIVIHAYGRVYDYFGTHMGWNKRTRFYAGEVQNGLTGVKTKVLRVVGGLPLSPRTVDHILSEIKI